MNKYSNHFVPLTVAISPSSFAIRWNAVGAMPIGYLNVLVNVGWREMRTDVFKIFTSRSANGRIQKLYLDLYN